jgi:hypothetical protein
MKKFIQRGWTVNAENPKMLFQVSELDLKNIEVLEEQLIELTLIFSLLITVLRDTEGKLPLIIYLN